MVQGGAGSLDFGDDLLGGLGPHERFGVVVPVGHPDIDRLGELADGVYQWSPRVVQLTVLVSWQVVPRRNNWDREFSQFGLVVPATSHYSWR